MGLPRLPREHPIHLKLTSNAQLFIKMHVTIESPILPHWNAFGFPSLREPPICPTDLSFLEHMVKRYLATPPGVEPPPAIQLDDRRLQKLNQNIRQLALRGYCLANGSHSNLFAQSRVHPSQDALWDSAIELADGLTRDLEVRGANFSESHAH